MRIKTRSTTVFSLQFLFIYTAFLEVSGTKHPIKNRIYTKSCTRLSPYRWSKQGLEIYVQHTLNFFTKFHSYDIIAKKYIILHSLKFFYFLILFTAIKNYKHVDFL